MGDTLTFTNVSCSPSKIPYGGFSPVRLQTGCQIQPSLDTPTYMNPHPRSRFGALIRNGTFIQSELLTSDVGTPVQRPLAPLRVIVSRWIIAYYALIRATRTRLTPYFLRLSNILRSSGSLLLSATLSRRAIPSTPANRIAAYDCYFTIHRSLRHLCRGSAFALSCQSVHAELCNEAILGSHYTTARRVASPSPTRTFTTKLSLAESPQTSVSYNYAVNSQLPRLDFHQQELQPCRLQTKST
jgi:hypothetical protein